MNDIVIYFLMLIFYSIIGWIIEVINAMLRTKRFINRGFLFGPWYPIYGLGGLFITMLTPTNPFLVFIFSFVICAIIEYGSSFFLEKVFNARWWDYSNDRININGRICLRNLVLFGLCGLIAKFLFSPLFFKIINSLSNRFIRILTIILLILYLIDTILSTKIVFKITRNKNFIKQDNTNEIRNYIKNTIGFFHN